MSYFRPILVVLGFVVLNYSAFTTETQQPNDEKNMPPMPWHLIDVWWDIGQDTPFESLAVDVIISDDVPSSVNLYISPIGLEDGALVITVGAPVESREKRRAVLIDGKK